MNTNYVSNYPTNTFQQSYMSQMNGLQNQPQNQNNNVFVTFAKGIEGAKQFPTNAGTITFIFDSTPNANVFYMKDTTGNGKPFRIFNYSEQEQVDETKELSDLKQEVADLKSLVASLAEPLRELMGSNGKDENNG